MADFFNTVTDSIEVPANLGAGANLGSAALVFANIAIILGIAVSFIAVSISLYKYMLSMGDPKAVQEAQRSLTWSIVAFILCLIAFGIKTILVNLLGVSLSSGTVSL